MTSLWQWRTERRVAQQACTPRRITRHVCSSGYTPVVGIAAEVLWQSSSPSCGAHQTKAAASAWREDTLGRP
jgi:hypothetical protein